MWFPFGLYYQSGCSQSHHCVHIVCNCHVRGGAVTVAGRSMPPSTPTSSQLLWPWCFSSLSDCSVRTVIVICQLWWSHHAYRKSGTALAHCLTFTPHTHTDTYTLPLAQRCRLSPILSSFHFFWWGGADLAGVLCDDHNHFDVSFILLSASILISL